MWVNNILVWYKQWSNSRQFFLSKLSSLSARMNLGILLISQGKPSPVQTECMLGSTNMNNAENILISPVQPAPSRTTRSSLSKLTSYLPRWSIPIENIDLTDCQNTKSVDLCVVYYGTLVLVHLVLSCKLTQSLLALPWENSSKNLLMGIEISIEMAGLNIPN